MTASPRSLHERISDVYERIEAAARRVGRSSSEVLLVAVSKTHGPDSIAAGYDEGLRHFGENRVEEAAPKIATLREKMPDATWHMIGHIQSRKAPDVAGAFDWVHSVERLKVARKISTTAEQLGRSVPVLLEVNVSGEESKDGFDLSRWPDALSLWDAFCREVEMILALPGISVAGLMTMAPYTEDPESARPIFRRMSQLREQVASRFPHQSWQHLSMGMTGDYEVAVEEGATMVRIGTAIFGQRNTMPG